jgi:DedD protein
MEDRGLRDIERWRDKIEVRLDNRQVFFLFFGSALVACMLFVLGVIVGKRLESRGRAVSPEIEDPLALLDKVATSPRSAQAGVTFPQALFGSNGKATASDKNAKKNAPAPAVALMDNAGDNVKAASKSTGASADPATTTGSSKTVKAEAKAESKPEGKATLASVEPKKTEAVADKGHEAATKPAEPKEAKPAVIPTIASGKDNKSKGRFTLQLSSFQDKAEAEAFAKKFSNEHPYMVMSDIPDKGVWYRVRVGDYASMKDAIAAKEAFEKKHSVIAYVAQK